jgi:hypothetical protein
VYSNFHPWVAVFYFCLILPCLMSTSIKAKIVELHLRHLMQEEIVGTLRTGRSRISRCPRASHHPGTIPDSRRIGRPSIRGRELIAFVETRTLRTPLVSRVDLAREVSEHLGLAISRSTVNISCLGIRFKFKPSRHTQILTRSHIPDRVAFFQKCCRCRMYCR